MESKMSFTANNIKFVIAPIKSFVKTSKQLVTSKPYSTIKSVMEYVATEYNLKLSYEKQYKIAMRIVQHSVMCN